MFIYRGEAYANIVSKEKNGSLSPRSSFNFKQRVSRIDKRVSGIDKRLSRIGKRVSRIDKIVSRIDKIVSRIGKRVSRIDKKVKEFGGNALAQEIQQIIYFQYGFKFLNKILIILPKISNQIIEISLIERVQAQLKLCLQISFEFANLFCIYRRSITKKCKKSTRRQSRKINAFDVEESHYSSQQLASTLRSKQLLPKYRLFQQISDWNERYLYKQSALIHQHSEEAKKSNYNPKFKDFTLLFSLKKKTFGVQRYSPKQKIERSYLTSIKIQFANARTKKKLQKQPENISNLSEHQSGKKSHYELNYEPLNKLYLLKTKFTSRPHQKSCQQSLVIFLKIAAK